MPVGYIGVLRDGRIEWTGNGKPPDGPVLVLSQDEPPLPEADRLAVQQALESLAAGGRINAAEWERQREELESYDPWERARSDAR